MKKLRALIDVRGDLSRHCLCAGLRSQLTMVLALLCIRQPVHRLSAVQCCVLQGSLIHARHVSLVEGVDAVWIPSLLTLISASTPALIHTICILLLHQDLQSPLFCSEFNRWLFIGEQVYASWDATVCCSVTGLFPFGLLNGNAMFGSLRCSIKMRNPSRWPAAPTPLLRLPVN
mgnify:FL=1